MAFQIPSRENKRWVVKGFDIFKGFLTQTFNVDLRKKPGRLLTTKLKKTTDSSSNVNWINPATAIRYYDGNYYAFTTDDILKASTAVDTFSSDSGAPTVNGQEGDLEIFNGDLYVYDVDVFHKKSASTWNSDAVTGLTSGSTFLLERFNDRLYYSEDDLFVGSIDSSDTKATAGNTIDFSNFLSPNVSTGRNTIAMLESGINSLWIATLNTLGQPGYIFQWDGETQNTFTAKYIIPDASIFAGVVDKETGTPFVFDTRGRLQQFNGTGFTEVGRLPLEDGRLFSSSSQIFRAVHPNGMVIKDEEVLIHVNTKTTDGKHHCPSGVWAYHKDTGLYHKYSITRQPIGDTGTTNQKEYGQTFFDTEGDVGAIMWAYEDGDAGKNGDLLVSSSYYTDRSTQEYGIFVNDLRNETQESGWFTTTWLEAEGIEDAWKEIIAKHEKLRSSGDEVEIKYRTEEKEGVTSDITFTSANTFTTTDSDYSTIKTNFNNGEAYDVVILVGDNAGETAQITNITESSGTYTVTVAEDFLVTSANTSKAFTQNWKRIKTQGNQNETFTRATVGDTSTKVQFKVVMTWQGDNQLEELFISNKENTLAQ